MSALRDIALVGAGGFFGSACRFALSVLVHRWLPAAVMPWGTLVVNVGGCAAIGLIAGYTDVRQFAEPGLRLFVVLGFLGGFTTFSTFGYETMALVRDGAPVRAGLNVLLSVVLCLVAVWLGFAVGSGVRS